MNCKELAGVIIISKVIKRSFREMLIIQDLLLVFPSVAHEARDEPMAPPRGQFMLLTVTGCVIQTGKIYIILHMYRFILIN